MNIKKGLRTLFLLLTVLIVIPAFAARQSDDLLRLFIPDQVGFSIPDHMGKIEQVSYGNLGKTVILIRDIHSHYQAQKSISNILQYLTSNYNIDSCFVEGFSGTMDLTPFTRYPDSMVRKNVSEKYLQSSKITGEEYFDITMPGSMTIHGLEDKELYEDNLTVFREVLTDTSSLYEYLDSLQRSIIESASSDDERKVLISWNDYLSLTGDVDTFMQTIESLGVDVTADGDRYPQVARYQAIMRVKDSIDMDRFQQEHAVILSLLETDMSPALASSFKLLVRQFLAGRLPEQSFFEIVTDLIADPSRNITAERYPNFFRYIEFINLSHQLVVADLTGELFDFGAAVLKDSLCGAPCISKFKALYHTVYMGRVLRCELTPAEAKKLCAMPENNLRTLWDESMSIPVEGMEPPDPELISTAIKRCKEHYTIAFKRDNAMAQRLMKQTNATMSVCITGGFHTTGIRELLNERGYTTVVIVPAIRQQAHNSGTYRSIMLNKLDNIEQLFARETSTLRQAALVWRTEQHLAMQYQLLVGTIEMISDPSQIKPVLSRLLVEAQVSPSATEELMHYAVLYEDQGTFYFDIPQHNITLKIRAEKTGEKAYMELLKHSGQRVPQEAKAVDFEPVRQALGISTKPISKDINPRDFATKLYESIPILDTKDYFQFLRNMKRLLSHERIQDDFLRIMIFEAALDYSGYSQVDEFTQQELIERFSDAEVYLKYIYKSDFHRKDFVAFLANYNRVNVRYNNYLMPLYITAFNAITHRALTSRDLIRTNHDLFPNADTVTTHPWFGMSQTKTLDDSVKANLIPAQLKGKTIVGGKRMLRVLLIGGQENVGPKSSGKMLRKFLDSVPTDMWDEITIESRDAVFPEVTYMFDAASGNPNTPRVAFSFDENGIHYSKADNITYRKITPGDNSYDPLAPDFNPQDRFDLVITSDLGLGQFTTVEQYRQSIDNLHKMLDDRGILISGMGELGFAEVSQKRGDTIETFDRMIPFVNMSASQRQIDSLKSNVTHISPGDHMMIQKAIDIRTHYQTTLNPSFDIITYAQFLALFGENARTVTAFILQDVPEEEIEQAFKDDAAQILKTRREFHWVNFDKRWSHIFPAVINLQPSDPSDWIINESDEEAIMRFHATTTQPFSTLYDNGRYRFEFGYYRHNAVMFVTKYHENMSSTKAFIISNISPDIKDVVYQSNIDVVKSIVSSAENINFGEVPFFIPAIASLESSEPQEFSNYWNDQWVRPSPKHLRIAALFIQELESIKKEDLILFNGVVYSKDIAENFIKHPLVRNNIKEGARILTALYYLNPQLVSVILRSLDANYLPFMRLLIMQTLNEQVARMINLSIRPIKGTGKFTGLPMTQYTLLQLLAPSTFDDEYRKNIGEIFQHLTDPTLVTLMDQLNSLVVDDFQEGWASAVIAQAFHTEVPKERKNKILKALSNKKRVWLDSQQLKLNKPVLTLPQIRSFSDGFLAMAGLIDELRKSAKIDFDHPSARLKGVIDRYNTLNRINNNELSEEDLELINSAIINEKTLGLKTYNAALTNIFMNIFNGLTHPEDAAFALEQIYTQRPALARTIVRSIARGKHHQMGSILFLMNTVTQTKIIETELEPLSERSVQRFTELDGFAMFIMINFRHFVNANDNIPQDDLANLIYLLKPETIRNLLIHGYYFYSNNPGFAFMTKDFIEFAIEKAGEDTVNNLFAEQTEQNINIRQWIKQDIFEMESDHIQQIAQMLEQNSDYQKLRKTSITLDNMASHLESLMYYLNDTREEMPGKRVEMLDTMILNTERAIDLFKTGYIYRGMREYGKTADSIYLMIDANKQFAENTSFRLAHFLSHKIDTVLSQYIAQNNMGRIKSLLPFERNKVVGKLRIIPNTPEGVKLLFDQDYLDEGFAVVSQYPQNIATMAKPRAIIAEEGIGRDEHAAERAADWKIPYIIMPHARSLLAGLEKDGEKELWVTIELGGRTSQNRIRKATSEEIEEENAYRLNAPSAMTTQRKVTPIKPDLSVRTINALDKMGLNNNVHAGNKTARLGHMRNNGMPVKNGFVLPFGFYDKFAADSGLQNSIQEILSQPDFNDNMISYLSQIRRMVMETSFSKEQESEILKWYHEHLGGVPVIARSSTNAEDLPGYAGAGVYDSFPNLKNNAELLAGIKKVYASVWTERAYINRQMNGIEHTDVYPSTLVQEMSPAKFSGVVNSANELSNNTDESTMSIDVGHGGGVDGMAAEFVYDRIKNTLVEEETDIPDNLAGTVVDDLSLKTFGQLDALALTAQELFGTPQKIEFSFDSKGYWINQAKDLQVFRSQEPSEDQQPPSEHTMTVINHSGLYLKTAKRLAEVAVEYLSSIKIVKLTGYGKQTPDTLQSADAKEILKLLDMNVRQGDSLLIVAQGPDAHAALNALSTLIYDRLGEPEHPDDLASDINNIYHVGQPQTPVFTAPEPEFFILTVPNQMGLHARPAGNFAI